MGQALINESYSSTAVITGETQIAGGPYNGRGMVVVVHSTQAGKLDLDYIDSLGNTRLAALKSQYQCTANQTDFLDFDFFIRAIRPRFTPDAATAGSVVVEAYWY